MEARVALAAARSTGALIAALLTAFAAGACGEDAVKVADLEDTGGPQRWTFGVPRTGVWRWVRLWSDALRVEVARAGLEN